MTPLCDLDEAGRCSRCGRTAYSPLVRRECVVGLGGMAAAGLSAIGITVERANAVAQVFGFDDCGCESRKVWLDALGKRFGIG